jgi:hypothetical protein
LLPGVIFAIFADYLFHYSFIQHDIITGSFLYYFIGLVVSRFGSLILDPILKRFSIIHFANHDDFIAASDKDVKLEVLSEVNNMFRTLCSLFGLLLLIGLYSALKTRLAISREWDLRILIPLLFSLFMYAHRKQTIYITNRIVQRLKGI